MKQDQLIVIDTPAGIEFVSWLSLQGALKLEERGMKRRGDSALSIARRRLGLPGRPGMKKVRTAVDAKIEELKKVAHGKV